MPSETWDFLFRCLSLIFEQSMYGTDPERRVEWRCSAFSFHVLGQDSFGKHGGRYAAMSRTLNDLGMTNTLWQMRRRWRYHF